MILILSLDMPVDVTTLPCICIHILAFRFLIHALFLSQLTIEEYIHFSMLKKTTEECRYLCLNLNDKLEKFRHHCSRNGLNFSI